METNPSITQGPIIEPVPLYDDPALLRYATYDRYLQDRLRALRQASLGAEENPDLQTFGLLKATLEQCVTEYAASRGYIEDPQPQSTPEHPSQ